MSNTISAVSLEANGKSLRQEGISVALLILLVPFMIWAFCGSKHNPPQMLILACTLLGTVAKGSQFFLMWREEVWRAYTVAERRQFLWLAAQGVLLAGCLVGLMAHLGRMMIAVRYPTDAETPNTLLLNYLVWMVGLWAVRESGERWDANWKTFRESRTHQLF